MGWVLGFPLTEGGEHDVDELSRLWVSFRFSTACIEVSSSGYLARQTSSNDMAVACLVTFKSFCNQASETSFFRLNLFEDLEASD